MKIPVWATILTICGVLVLCSLGLWQVKRLSWKNSLIQSIQREYAYDATRFPLIVDNFKAYSDFKRGFLRGAFLHDQSVNIQGRTYDGAPGYHVLTPFLIADRNRVILVNRGWIPLEREREDGFAIVLPDGDVAVTGMLRPVPSYNLFVPDNIPAERQWYRISPDDVARHYALDNMITDRIFYVEQGQNNAEADELVYPIPVSLHKMPSNNHAQYAFFWFAMACALFGVYCVRFIIPQCCRAKLAVDEKD